MKQFLTVCLFILAGSSLNAQVLISGVIDGPLSGGTPKAVEFYVYEDIADLSIFGFGSANNGGGSDGEEFTFPADAATAGSFIYVATEATGFNDFFGFLPNYTNGTAPSISGDDAIELFKDGIVVDVFGDINVDGTGEAWDYLDGWAYRNDQTGPDGSTFVLANWSFSGTNALDGETSNSTATIPFPIGTFSYGAAVTPDAPLATAATSITNDSFTANWDASSGATTYFLDVSELLDFSTFATGYDNKDIGNITSTSVTSLNSTTDYYYRVRANNSAGTSSNSNTIALTTVDLSQTSIQFKIASASASETEGSYNLEVSISNPSASIASSADVVLIVGDAADIDNYITQTVTFPAGSSADKAVIISITDDGVDEGNETLTFELQNVAGGNSASIGSTSQFDLTIIESYDGTYYDPITPGATGAQLKFELYNLINDHIEYPYTSASTDVWDILMESDEDPNNPNNVMLIYTGRSQDKSFNASTSNDPDAWNREHVWAKSRGDFGTDPPAGSDAHHLRPADASVNGDRSNKDFDESDIQHSEATECFFDSDSWEPRDEVKGDVARMLFYMAVRYEGERGEPELHLVDYTETATGEPLIGKLSTLLEWHQNDLPDAFEMNRNETIAFYQQNRNPFIDHPEWVDDIWGAGSENSPIIVSVLRNLKVPNSDENLEISAVVTDNSSVSNVTLNYQVDEGPEQSIVMSATGADTYVGTISESEYNEANLLSYYVVAEDDESNFVYGYVKEVFTGLTPISVINSVKSDGRVNYKGTYTRVQGVATVSTGIFSITSLDVFIQDETGGVNIYKSGDVATTITEGNIYSVCGQIDQFNGKTELIPDVSATDISYVGPGIIPSPMILTIDQLLSDPESFEGQLVTIQQANQYSGSSVNWPISANANYEITDNNSASMLILRIDKETDLDDNLEPTWPKDVTGIFSQYDDFFPYSHDYQIQPRKYSDISNSVLAKIKVNLQGPYNNDSNLMVNPLNSSIPNSSPFLENPRKVLTIHEDIVDWVLVELRETFDGAAISSHSALLHKDGRIVADDGISDSIRLKADPGLYYIVVKHRNHIPVMGLNKVSLSSD